MRESDIEKKFTQEIKKIGGIAYKFSSPGRTSVPDRLVLIKDFCFFAEIKAPKKPPTMLQKLEHVKISEYGFKVLVIDSFESIKNCMTWLKDEKL
jgi:hypothetical protein